LAQGLVPAVFLQVPRACSTAAAMSSRLVVLVLAALFPWSLAGAPRHARFRFNHDVIELLEKPELRLNVKGGGMEPGDPLVLWPCSPHMHEIFNITGGSIHLVANMDLCLNAEAGVSRGTRIITWPCAQDGVKVPHEDFVLGADGRIRVAAHPDMCIAVKGDTVQNGAEIVLLPCLEDNRTTGRDVFSYNGGMIQVAARPSYHFNVKGGDVAKLNSPLVLWGCEPSNHEVFERTDDKRLRLKRKPDLCVNAAHGVGHGASLIAWPCDKNEAQPNEQFEYDEKLQIIYSVAMPHLVFNAKGGGMQQGDEIVLWPLDAEEL